MASPSLRTTAVLLLCVCSSASALEVPGVARESSWEVGQTVKTTSGSIIGHAAKDVPDVAEYLGIPYAQAPTGKLRWQRPQRYITSDTFDAHRYGPSCMGASINTTLPLPKGGNQVGLDLAVQLLNHPVEQSEDCLNLNIWTKPQTGEAKKPVLVFIHGGNYVIGSSAFPPYSGRFFVDNEDIVLVSFNYRLGIFGSPGNPNSPPNLMLLDSRMAVEWVHDNIAGFGGDPDRIVIFGESAGAGSVDVLVANDADEDGHPSIIKGGITMSGVYSSNTAQALDAAAAKWYDVTEAAGCGDAETEANALMECMLKLDAAEIIASIAKTPKRQDSGRLWYPTADDDLVMANQNAVKAAKTPMVIGYNDAEYDLLYGFASDLGPAWIRDCLEVDAPVWRYRFFGQFPNTLLRNEPANGAWHGSELSILFGTTPEDVIENTPAQNDVTRYMQGAWSAFAHDPIHGLERYAGGWPRWEGPGSKTLAQVAFEGQAHTHMAVDTDYEKVCGVINDDKWAWIVAPIRNVVFGLVGAMSGGSTSGLPM